MRSGFYPLNNRFGLSAISEFDPDLSLLGGSFLLPEPEADPGFAERAEVLVA